MNHSKLWTFVNTWTLLTSLTLITKKSRPSEGTNPLEGKLTTLLARKHSPLKDRRNPHYHPASRELLNLQLAGRTAPMNIQGKSRNAMKTIQLLNSMNPSEHTSIPISVSSTPFKFSVNKFKV